MQAAGIARSWRSNRTNSSQQYQDNLLQYQKKLADGTLDANANEPNGANRPCLPCENPVFRPMSMWSNWKRPGIPAMTIPRYLVYSFAYQQAGCYCGRARVSPFRMRWRALITW